MSTEENKLQIYSKLPFRESAAYRVSFNQLVFIFAVISVVLSGLLFYGLAWLKILLVLSLVYYIVDFTIYGLIILTGLFTDQAAANEQTDKRVSTWPKYTILCPLYKETSVLPQFVKAMKALDYPKRRLQIMLLLEEDDHETIAAAQAMNLPKYFEIVVVPDSLPKTKPKACNYGLTQTTGEYVVIYDAEDIPDPKQLKLAAAVHLDGQGQIGCVQAKLNFYNPKQNFLTRLFTLEYSLWFEVVLPGLMAIRAPLPLGGTSNHFPTKLLKQLHGWDPFNVTEDADLGMRITQLGYKTVIIDSTTMEEANSNVRSWIKQRSRWIKGYMQTYLVHTRQLHRFWNNGPKRNLLLLNVILGIRSFGLLLNAGLFVLFIVVQSLRLVGSDTVNLPAWLSYLLIANMVLVNIAYIYTYMLGIAKRNQWYLLSTVLLVPFYWLLLMLAAVQAFYELIFKPFYWQKTTHGLHLQEAEV